MDKEIFQRIYLAIEQAERVYGRHQGVHKKDFVISLLKEKVDPEILSILIEGILAIPVVASKISKISKKCGCL